MPANALLANAIPGAFRVPRTAAAGLKGKPVGAFNVTVGFSGAFR
jgi:hypothetical protein